MIIRLYEGILRNRAELCRELDVAQVHDRCDTERAIIEAGLRRWGRELVRHLYGAFAFVVWDEEEKTLFCVGRSARANGITLLLPFADRRMFELSAAIPSALKRKDETAKYILRKAAETRLSHTIVFRPKVGFSVPAKRWFREERFRGQIEGALFGDVSREYFDQDFLRKCWRSFREGCDDVWRIPYMVYIFVLWYENCYDLDEKEGAS